MRSARWFALEATREIQDADLVDGVQLMIPGSTSGPRSGETPAAEITLPAEALPPGTTVVTAFVNTSNPRETPDLSPGNFLASDSSSYITGQALTVCGGSNMWS